MNKIIQCIFPLSLVHERTTILLFYLVMARPRQRLVKPVRKSKLSKIPFDVLCLRLQALNLPTSGPCVRLLQRLKFAKTNDVPVTYQSPRSRTCFGRVTKSKFLTPPARQLEKVPHYVIRDKFTAQSPSPLKKNGLQTEQDCRFDADFLLDSPVVLSETNDAVLSSDQQLVVQATDSSSVKVVLANLRYPDGPLINAANPQTKNNHRVLPRVATPLILNHQLNRDLEEKIFGGKSFDPLDRI